MNKQLNAVLMPSGVLMLEWKDTEQPVKTRSRLYQQQLYDIYLTGGRDWLLFLGFGKKDVDLSPSIEFFRGFSRQFLRQLVKIPELEKLRHEAFVPFHRQWAGQYLETAPMMTGGEYLSLRIMESAWKRLNRAFARAIENFDGTVEAFVESHGPDIHLAGRIFFHLVENKRGAVPFAFLATYSTGEGEDGKGKHQPLKHALTEYGKDGKKLLELLSTVHRAARDCDLIREILESGELFQPLGLSSQEAFTFLRRVPLYEDAGIICRIPNWWKGKASGASLRVSLGDKSPSRLGTSALLTFDATLFVGDEPVSEQEARELLEHSRGLALIKGKWVAADPERLEKVLEAYDRAKELIGGQGMTLQEAFRFQLHPEKYLADEENSGRDVSVSNGQWLEAVMEKMIDPDKIEAVDPGSSFKARLRPYQEKGVNWLWFLHSLGMGACLADDMGLGKTIQLLGFLCAVQSENGNGSPNRACLLVLPASLIANWESEILRFSPDIKYFIAHPGEHKNKDLKDLDEKELESIQLVITTYGLVQKYGWLRSYRWNYVILDEAQAIKNPGTKQTRAVKKLTASNRIIMTGTPIENRLSDLWSLFDFLNPGLLGNAREFNDFSKRIQNDLDGYSRLRKVIRPYVLRRLKTDKKVISDLPDKVEMKVFTSLSRKQVLLYEQLVEELERTLEQTEGIQRKGVVLASLMKFKQLCNHPDQYLGTGGFEEKNSGKFARLREIAETIYEKRERALVFTQFKEMTEPLAQFLEQIFKGPGLILHGSVPVGKRKKLIDKFQGKQYVPFMVLSLKAGGVGLNLTEANHVIHFDRWWNPAVENQATDRAFRIGQTRKVLVHKFVTKGTVEEKIDAMLEDKAKLSREVVAATGEKWITEMKTEELMNLFRLGI